MLIGWEKVYMVGYLGWYFVPGYIYWRALEDRGNRADSDGYIWIGGMVVWAPA